MTLDRARIEAIGLRWLELLRTLDERGHRDIDAMMALFAPDVDYEIPFLAEPVAITGADALRAFFGSMQGRFAEVSFEVLGTFIDVDTQTLCLEARGSRLLLPARTPYANRYIFRITLADGRIAAMREYVNPLLAMAAAITPDDLKR